MVKALLLGVCLAAPITAQTATPRSGTPNDAPPVRSELTISTTRIATASSPLALVKEKYEVVKIKTEDDLEISGAWYEPHKSSKRVAGIVLIHDAGGDRSKLEKLAERIAKARIAVLSIDLRGHGESKTEDCDWSKASAQEKKALWAFAQKDVDAAVKWLLSQESVHPTRLCMLGYREGCALVARHMKTETNALAVALLEPPQEAYGFDLERDLLDLEGIPTRIVSAQGNGDKEAEAMAKKVNEKARGGNPFIEFFLEQPPMLENSRSLAKIAGFFKSHGTPSRGR